MPPWLVPFLGFLQPILDRVLPDKGKQAELTAQLALAAQAQAGAELQATLQLSLAQVGVNQTEAANSNLFVSGGRPFLMWICGFGFAVQFVIGPLSSWIGAITGHPFEPPHVDIEPLWTLCAGMLGLSGMRTYEKVKGATK